MNDVTNESPSPTEKLSLVIDLEYALNGVDPRVIRSMLDELPIHAAANGMFTGSSDAEVVSWDSRITPRLPVRRSHEEIMSQAGDAAFYCDEAGNMFRMNYVDPEEQRFEVLNEDNGEEFWIEASEVSEQCKFFKLVEA